MIKRLFTLNTVFTLYCVVFVAIVSGILPRATGLVAVVLIAVWMLRQPTEEGVLFFIRSVPLFIALPLTASYDNLNMWRPLSLILFARLAYEQSTWTDLKNYLSGLRTHTSDWIRTHSVLRRCVFLLILAGLSLIGASHGRIGIIRIIYFVNLSIVPVILYALVRQGRLTTERVITNLAIPTMIVVAVGLLQLASTYLIDVYQFMQLWGEKIQLRQFGEQWSYIAVWVGNTWLAYYGDQLSLRVFSLFPDSHSFPTYVLLGIPALFAISLDPILRLANTLPVRRLVRSYSAISIVWVVLAMLAAILSGTRGIWAASVGVVLLAIGTVWCLRHQGTDIVRRRVFSYISLYLIAFYLLFSVAWPVFISPQFLLGKGDLNLFGHRLRSIIDFGETSNALRLKIWAASISSIKEHPLLGVGIGNFPVVLDEDIRLARAGSTAHNLYLHVAAEMGIIAAVEMVILLAHAWFVNLRWFRRASGRQLVYSGALLLYLPWVYAYVLTDPIIFDERVYLMFATTLALVWANDHA